MRSFHDFAIEFRFWSLVRRFVRLAGRCFARGLTRPLRGRRLFRCLYLGSDIFRRRFSDSWTYPDTNDDCDGESSTFKHLVFRHAATAPIQIPRDGSRVR